MKSIELCKFTICNLMKICNDPGITLTYLPKRDIMDAAAPHNDSDQAKATRDQGQPTKTNASARSASRNHSDLRRRDDGPNETVERPCGRDGRRRPSPRRTTEPPNTPEGTKVEGVETGASRVSREVEEDPGEDGNEQHRPRRPDEPPSEPRVESAGPTDVEVEPGGETGEVECNRCAARENADADVDREVAWACRDAEIEVESVKTRRNASIEGESAHATVHAQSMMAVEEDSQRTPTNDDDVPRSSPDPSPSFPSPDETAIPQNEPPSVELEGERIPYPSCDDGPTSDDADVTGVSRGVEDAGRLPRKLWGASLQAQEHSRPMEEENSPEGAQSDPNDPEDSADTSAAAWAFEDVVKRPKKLREASERVSERSEDDSEKYSPGRPGEEPDEPDGETVVPGDVHSTREGPIGVTSDVGGGMNAPSRDTCPGGHRGEDASSRGVEGVRDRANVVDRAGYDGKNPRSEENERDGGTDARTRETGPLGHRGEQVELGGDEGDLERQSCGDGDDTDGRRGIKDGATSGTRRDSKRVETGQLAEDETSQHEQRERKAAHVPRPSTPPNIDPRRPIDHPNPPRRRGRLKSRPTRVSNPRRPTRSHGRVKAGSGGSDASHMLYMDRRWW